MTIRWGIIGCGAVTEVKSGPAYQLTQGFELTAVMRRRLDKAKDYAQRHHVQSYYNDADKLINDDRIDAVYIATPPDSHARYALKVAEAGKICCVEKPMAFSYEECVTMQKAFAAKGIPLFVAYYRRSLPRFQQVKAWLDSGAIGAIRHISWSFCKPANNFDLTKTYNWHTDDAVAYGGYFDDLASHGLDLFNYLLGNVKEATGLSVNQQGLYTAKDAVVGSWLYKSGVTGSGSWNFGAHLREDNVEIYGDKGKLSFAVFQEDALKLSNQEGNQELFIENPKHIQIHHVENMQKQLSGGSAHPSTAETATHSSWVMDKILGRL